ncbi:hypothetical protein SNE40_020843 [Patella caerulea]|uniref:Uncharacterized protein n=1 Tax=Patella caerulea TaxID=87958 RepID=A0AAN8J642_PATCE
MDGKISLVVVTVILGLCCLTSGHPVYNGGYDAVERSWTTTDDVRGLGEVTVRYEGTDNYMSQVPYHQTSTTAQKMDSPDTQIDYRGYKEENDKVDKGPNYRDNLDDLSNIRHKQISTAAQKMDSPGTKSVNRGDKKKNDKIKWVIRLPKEPNNIESPTDRSNIWPHQPILIPERSTGSQSTRDGLMQEAIQKGNDDYVFRGGFFFSKIPNHRFVIATHNTHPISGPLSHDPIRGLLSRDLYGGSMSRDPPGGPILRDSPGGFISLKTGNSVPRFLEALVKTSNRDELTMDSQKTTQDMNVEKRNDGMKAALLQHHGMYIVVILLSTITAVALAIVVYKTTRTVRSVPRNNGTALAGRTMTTKPPKEENHYAEFPGKATA